jgi:hypothetical protein
LGRCFRYRDQVGPCIGRIRAGPGGEQYLMMPAHAARAALVATGVIGTPTQVQVSSTQQYHVIALIRGLLGAGRGRFRSGLAG